MEDNISTEGVWGVGGSGGNASDGERWGATDEASLACPQLTSCRAAQLLTERGPLSVCGPGVGDPCLKGSPELLFSIHSLPGERAII